MRQDRPDLVLARHPELPVPAGAAPGLPVPRLPVLGLPVPEGRAALAASRGVDRSRDRLTAGRFRSPVLGPVLALARMVAGRMAAGRMAAGPGRAEREGWTRSKGGPWASGRQGSRGGAASCGECPGRCAGPGRGGGPSRNGARDRAPGVSPDGKASPGRIRPWDDMGG